MSQRGMRAAAQKACLNNYNERLPCRVPHTAVEIASRALFTTCPYARRAERVVSCRVRRVMSIKWNEANLQANEEEATAANRMQITEPKTPFHYLGDDGEPEAYPPKAAPATAAPREAKQAASQQLQPGMDLSKLASAALERREEQPEPEDEPEGATACRMCTPTPHPRPRPCPRGPAHARDAHVPRSRADKRRKFDQHRKAHYQTGGLAALRAQAAAAMDEEEDDEEDDEDDGNKT